MSMPVNHVRSLLLAALPIILGICALALGAWLGLQSKQMPTGSSVMLHQALSNLPPGTGTSDDNLSASSAPSFGKDPFFRPLPKLPPATTAEPSEPIALEELHLTTIAQGKVGKYCLISGRIYHEGQAGNGFLITEIAPGKVHFETTIASFTLVPGQKIALESGKPVPIEAKDTTTTQQAER